MDILLLPNINVVLVLIVLIIGLRGWPMLGAQIKTIT
jgi:hypothetical protein